MLQPYPANWTLITPVLNLPITTTNFSKMASYLYPQVDSLQISHDNALLSETSFSRLEIIAL